MSLTKDKKQAKTALETLRQVESLLDVETRQRYRQALDAVAKYNGELRRERSTIVALADAATRPGETPREAQQSREIHRLQSENRQLREQVKLERNRPIKWSEDLIFEGLNKFVDDRDFSTLGKCAQVAAIQAVAAVCISVKGEAPPPPPENVTRWANQIAETMIEILGEYAPELADVMSLEVCSSLMPYHFSTGPQHNTKPIRFVSERIDDAGETATP